MQVNYLRTLCCLRAVVPSMMTRRRGTIAAISWSAGLTSVFGHTAYGPPTFAMRGLCDVLRIELKPHGIDIACIYPSDVDTPQVAGEEPYKPKELHRIAGTMKPIPSRAGGRRHPARHPATLTGHLRRPQDPPARPRDRRGRIPAPPSGMATLRLRPPGRQPQPSTPLSGGR
jgi:NAD(P)-dependent dehydrogenase (short-subunit alcohol dehydrogenase family)